MLNPVLCTFSSDQSEIFDFTSFRSMGAKFSDKLCGIILSVFQ